jgi:Ca2+-binding RTX toxin-like protein
MSGTDTISGGSGDDLLDGGRLGNFPADDTGNDTLFGDTGKDTLHASDHGNNTLDGGTNDDKLFGYAGLDTLRGGDGNDLLDGGTGADALWGGNGTDAVDYAGTTGLHTISLDDVANDGWFAIFAGEGDNAHSDIENVIGSQGNDVIWGNGAANVLDGRGGNDEIRGQGGDDRLLGGDGNDKLFGGSGRDTYFGQAGNDTLDAGNESATEADEFWGGSGTDIVTYASRSVGVRIQMDDLANDGFTGGTHGAGVELDNVHSDVENATGTSGSDGLYGNAFANRLIGGGGADYLAGGAGDDTLEGGDGDDILIGEAGNDRLLGGDGNDTIWAGDGSIFDTVDGGAGTDRVQIDTVGFFLSDSATNVEAWF